MVAPKIQCEVVPLFQKDSLELTDADLIQRSRTIRRTLTAVSPVMVLNPTGVTITDTLAYFTQLYEADPENFTIQIFQYATEAPSFDLYMWQTLEVKAKMISQVMSGKLNVRSVEDIGDQQIRSIE